MAGLDPATSIQRREAARSMPGSTPGMAMTAGGSAYRSPAFTASNAAAPGHSSSSPNALNGFATVFR